jgi:hypothetical protein
VDEDCGALGDDNDGNQCPQGQADNDDEIYYSDDDLFHIYEF